MLNNVPLTGQSLGNSRDQINGNFATINTAFSVNHVQYNDGSGNQGKHFFVAFPTAVATTPTLMNEVALYSRNGNTSTVPELCFQRQNSGANTGYAFTEGTNAAQGWTRLPSQLIMKWGSSTAPINSATAVTFTGLGATGPAFSTVYSVQVTSTGVPGNDNICTQVGAITATGFTVFPRRIGAGGTSPQPYTWLALGISNTL